MKEKYTRIELEEKLKKIKEEDAKLPPLTMKDFLVAMCYSRAFPTAKIKFEFNCSKCGQKVIVTERAYSEKEKTTLEKTIEIIEKIQKSGFDVEYELICKNCNEKESDSKYVGSIDYNIIFRFKTKDDVKYKETICNNRKYYQICLDFLNGDLDYRNLLTEHSVPEKEVDDVLYQMLGVKIDEN